MNNPGNSTFENPNQKKVIWILWLALINSLFIYLVVGYFTRQNNPPAEPAEVLPTLTAVLGFVSIAISVVIFAIGPRIAKNNNFFTYSIIRWAMSESIAIYGLVLFILGASWYVFGGFFIWSLFMLIIFMPNQGALDRFNSLKNRGRGISGSST